MKKRIAIWDNLKFLLIFLVVFGHFIERFISHRLLKFSFLYIYIFHMPAFIFISGLFSKKTINEKRYKKIFEYLILFFFIKFYILIVDIICLDNYKLDLLYNSGISWFLLSLIFFHLITILFQKLDKKYLFILSVILACFIGYDKNFNDFLALSRTIVYYPFFLAGYLLNPSKVLNFAKKKEIKILSFIFIISTLLITYLFLDKVYGIRPLLTGRNPFYTLGHFSKYGGIIRLIYYAGITLFIISLISLVPNRENIFTKLGARSLCVYIFHKPLITIFYELLNGKLLLDKMGYVLLIPISLVVTLVLSQECFKKILDYVKRIRYEKKVDINLL